ncbi:MAG TPA: cation-transporting P-type ATPase [bacterium]|nr:cation-transporting P-type ATPase [bacterium]
MVSLQHASLAQLATLDAEAVLRLLASRPEGLTSAEAEGRLAQYGPNEVRADRRFLADIVGEQLKCGINLLLGLAGLLTLAVGSLSDGIIILVLVVLNVGLSIFQEYRAERALEALRALLPPAVRVWRDGREGERSARELVPGDVIAIRGGNLVPADLRLLEADGLEVNQAALTGESLSEPKDAAAVPPGPPGSWSDVVFAGTTVVSGYGRGVVAVTGERTQFGETAVLVRDIRAASDFQVNLTRFGGFLLRFGLLLAVVVFVSNALLGHGLVVSLTLALALMLGTVPEALPAVTATTLALGAARLARKRVLVRRLAAVEDLSIVDTLCCDKTGTISQNRTAVTDIWTRAAPADVLEAALLCSSYPRKHDNIVDDAVIAAAEDKHLPSPDLTGLLRTTSMQFSSERKRMCMLVEGRAGRTLIVKGAADIVLRRCRSLRTREGDVELDPVRAGVASEIAALQERGERVLAVAVRALAPGEPAGAEADTGLTLLGLLGLADPPRPGAAAALARAEALHVRVKIVTGDAVRRATALAAQIGISASPETVVPAEALRGADAGAAAEQGRIFGEVTPADKFRLVRALQGRGGHVAVTGDGVNDAPALRAADVGIALASGSDAAKDAADLVLLEDDLGVIVDSVAEGRRLFTNINRYLLYTMVSNFANVIVVAIASLFLNFLPLRPTQVLVLNVLADLPMLAIVTDRVAAADLATPRRWDVRRLVEMTFYLGTLNALFAFGLLRIVRGQPVPIVYSTWFLLLGTTALLILAVARTPGHFWQAPPLSLALGAAVAAGLLITLALINVPLARRLFDFGILPWAAQGGILLYSLGYVVVADFLKIAFLHTTGRPPSGR